MSTPRAQAEPLPCISARMWSVPWRGSGDESDQVGGISVMSTVT